MTSVASIVNFQHVSHFILLLLLLNSNENKSFLGLRIYSFRQWNCFQQLKEIHFPMGWEILVGPRFHHYSPKIRLGKDNFSRQCFKKISRTLTILHLLHFVKFVWLIVWDKFLEQPSRRNKDLCINNYILCTVRLWNS